MRLVHLLILANCHMIGRVQLTAQLEGSPPPIDWLLRELNGAHLRLSIAVDPPWIIERQDSNGTKTFEGYVVEIVHYMAKAFNATYSFVPVGINDANELGLREAAVKLLMRNEIDINTKAMILNLKYFSLMDCSIPIFYEPSQLMVPWPKEETPIVAPIRPFQSQVWIWLPISIFGVSLTLLFLQKHYKKRNDQNTPVVSKLWNLLVYVVSGGGDWTGWNQLSFRLVQGAWCLAAFVLVNAYCSTLISYLISPRLMPVATTYQDVASGNPQKLKLLAEKNNIVATYSLQATSDPFKGLGDLLRRYPESQFTDREKGFEQMFTGDYAYIGTRLRVALFMAKAFKKTDWNCKFTISNANIDRMFAIVWSFQKKWRYTEAFNHRMSWLAESGLVNYWLKQRIPKFKTCSVENKKDSADDDDDRKILTLSFLSGPFILLACGLGLSILVFLLEKLYYNHKLRNARTQIIE